MHDFNTLFLQKGIKGNWSPTTVDVHNRAFLFGDGLFETMVFAHGKLQDFSLHQHRLYMGLELLSLDKSNVSTQVSLEKLLEKHVPSQNIIRVRWNVFRAGMGKYSPESQEVMETLQIQPFSPAPPVKKSAMISQKHRLFPHTWANCKTSNALVYVLANQERLEHQQEEIILLDDIGNVSEAGAANIFWKKGKRYYTPSLQTNCIAGVGRAKIIRALHENGCEHFEGTFPVTELMSADQVFVSNVTGISYLQHIQDRIFDTDSEDFLELLFEL